MIQQRLRVEFTKGEEIKYISHLDLMRTWHRSLRRAGIPIAYSEGFSPRPRLSLASPLPVGATAEGDLLDVFLRRRMSPLTFLKGIGATLPEGLEAKTAEEVPLSLPSLQSLVSVADYLVRGRTQHSEEDIKATIRGILAAKQLPWAHSREDKVRYYDLRALILDLGLVSWEQALGLDTAEFIMQMKLRADSQGTGRPDQVLAKLGLSEGWTAIHRIKVSLKRPGKQAMA